MKSFTGKALALIAVMAVVAATAYYGNARDNNSNRIEDIDLDNSPVSDNKDKSEFVCVGAEDIYSLDPFNDTSEYHSSVFSPVFDRLLVLNADGTLSPGLIDEWKESKDGLSYEFRLKSGVTFSNGKPFTTKALSMAWEYAKKDFKLSGNARWSVIDSITCIDDLNMLVKLRKCDPQFLLNVADSAYVEPDTFERVGAEKYWSNPLGCGRYTFAAYYQGQSITFYRNRNYWGDNSSGPEVITYRIVTDGDERVDVFCDNSADMITSIPYDRINDVRADVDVKLFRTAGTEELWLGTQCKPTSPCSDINLRRAISLCIDRSLIAVNIYGNGYPQYSISPSYIFGKSDYYGFEFYKHDVDKAKEYLKNSSYDGEALKLIVPISRFDRVDELVQTLNAMLNNVGINVEIQMLEGAAFMSARGNGEYDLCLQSHRFTMCDVKWMWQQFVYNHGKYHYNNNTALKLITDAYHSPDMEKASDYMNEALALMADDCAPIIPIALFETNFAYRSQWTGIKTYSDGRFDISSITNQ